MFRAVFMVLSLLVLPLVALAQQPPPSCEQKLMEAGYKTNMADMTTRYVRDTMAQELRQAMERVERAEQALATVKESKPPSPKPAEDTK